KKEREVQEYFSLSHMKIPGYTDASPEQKLEFVHHYAVDVMKLIQLDLPAYKEAKDAKGRSDALLAWLSEQEGFLLKPMNCPHHIHIYKAEPRSYRDLPVRL